MKVNPNRAKARNVNTTDDDFMRELQSLLEEDDVEVNPSDHRHQLEDQDNSYLDHGYFNMEDYHSGLADVENTLTKFLKKCLVLPPTKPRLQAIGTALR